MKLSEDWIPETDVESYSTSWRPMPRQTEGTRLRSPYHDVIQAIASEVPLPSATDMPVSQDFSGTFFYNLGQLMILPCDQSRLTPTTAANELLQSLRVKLGWRSERAQIRLIQEVIGEISSVEDPHAQFTPEAAQLNHAQASVFYTRYIEEKQKLGLPLTKWEQEDSLK